MSEAELLQSRPDGVVRLGSDPRPVLKALAEVGRTMVLTRNENCVHERKGRWEQVSVRGPVGLVVGTDIDLRLFLSQWAVAFAVETESRGAPLHSLQFFDAHGDAIFKVYLDRAEGDLEAWQQLIDTHKAELPAFVATPRQTEATDLNVPVPEALLEEWAALQDTHDFFGMLRKHKVPRLTALRAAVHRFTERLDRQVPTHAAGAGFRAEPRHHGLRGQPRLHPDPHGPRVPASPRSRVGSMCWIRTSTCTCAPTTRPRPSSCASRPRTAS